MTAESIMHLALSIGLTVADLDSITVGMLNDLACAMSEDNGAGEELSYDEL